MWMNADTPFSAGELRGNIYTDFSHRLHTGSRQARDSRESIKPRIKAQDSFDSVVSHDGQMNSITRRHLSMPHDNFLCALLRPDQRPAPGRQYRAKRGTQVGWRPAH